jgi:hypothetical protein
MSTTPITVSFPLGLFNSATMILPPAKTHEEASTSLTLEREFLDAPGIIPETEGADDYYYLDET